MQPNQFQPVPFSRDATAGQQQSSVSQPYTNYPSSVGRASAIGQQLGYPLPSQSSHAFPVVSRAPAQPFPGMQHHVPQFSQQKPQPTAHQVQVIQQQQGGDLMFPVAKKRS